MPPAKPRIMPPVYLLVAIIAMIALDYLLPVRQLIEGPWRWLGGAIIVLALAWGVWTVRQFRRHKTTIKPGEASTSLMTGGPFRVCRNPIYLGMTCILFGTAIALGSLSPWLVVPVFVLIIARKIIPVEEAMLQKVFGEEYARYRARVRRWI